MKSTHLLAMAAAAADLAAAAKTARTFAVMRFNGEEIHNGRIDPIVNPNGVSPHVHTVQGSSGFGPSANGESLRAANCTNSKLKGDMSNYWFPRMYFRDPDNGTLEAVPMFYTNAYYFFEATDDDLKAFPLGLSMLSGNVSLRTPPSSGTGAQVLDPKDGEIQPVGFTCPRSSYTPSSWPADSDGSWMGIQDPNNQGQGVGFPNQNCDGYASPMRADIHFPSCYNPEAGVSNHLENMAWPTAGNGATAEARASGRANCPDGWVHVPHLFIEVYWNTPLFANRWTQGGKTQPFVLSNGDVTGYSLHADFMSGWDETLLQNIIDNCNAGHQGMEYCPGVESEVNTESCFVSPFIEEDVDGPFQALPGGDELTGWNYGSGNSNSGSELSTPSSAASSSAAASTYGAYAAESVAPVAAVSVAPPSTPAAVTPAAVQDPTDPDCTTSQNIRTVWETVTEFTYAKPTSQPEAPTYGRRHLISHRRRRHMM
ncbi:uncharacterized protein BROUX77_003198 [Berkeleyomyces rouxiae]|uniref:uncharacterized protein n=1 Tax=Berkeleyomyces rouxiae TaxID=2035830 RepID=UPI003B7A924C